MLAKLHVGFERIATMAGEQTWLDGPAATLQDRMTRVYDAAGAPGRAMKNVLHGTWLGHPLHPLLTDIPIGFFTSTAALEALEMCGMKRFRRAADTTLAMGLISAFGAGAVGATDWQHTNGRARRVGLAHALFNMTASALYACSLIDRMRGKRRRARFTSMLGLATLNLGGYLGGHLVFAERVGVNHAPDAEGPGDFVPVMRADELRDGSPHYAEADGTPIVLVRTGGQVYALAEKCAHQGGPLSEGRLDGDAIICPWHGSRIELATGLPKDGPSTYRQPCFETRVRDERIEVRALPQKVQTS